MLPTTSSTGAVRSGGRRRDRRGGRHHQAHALLLLREQGFAGRRRPDAQHDLALARIERWTVSDAPDAGALTNALFAEFATWCRRPAWPGSGFTRAAIEHADAPGHPARRSARRHKKAVEEALVAALEVRGVAPASAAARELMLLIEGANALVLIHADPA